MGPSDSPRRLELTISALILGAMLSVIMGAANVYLGLKAGMTVSASIPAAVIALGVLRGILGRRSILEANLVQTAASAGESLAAGIIFTMPALILVGVWTEFNYVVTTLIALAGGLLGILLMIPMRRVFVVDNKELSYPEGLACAEVLRAGGSEEDDASDSRGGSGLALVLGGIALGGIFKFSASFLGLVRGAVEVGTIQARRVFFMGADISPALLAVGFIVGLPIAIQIFLGGAIGWLVALPLLGLDTLGEAAADMSAVEAAGAIWKKQIRHMGVGAMLVGGIASIWRVRRGLRAAMGEVVSMFSSKPEAEPAETDRNISGPAIVGLTIVSVLLIAGIYYTLLGGVALTTLTTVIMIVMSFFFAAVASYIVGLVGNSNSPVSGMTITAVLGTGLLIYLFGFGGEAGIIATLGVAGVVCCVACTSGDVCNDLKTGHLVGASPRLQQIMQVVGVVFAAFVLAPVLTILHEGYEGGIGGRELPAPQAGLFAELVNGFFGDKELPRNMVAIGIGIGVALLVGDWLLQRFKVGFRLYVMPVAVGIYLPLSLSTPILLGGLAHALASRGARGKEGVKGGVLLASGVIAGESLIGVLLGLLAYLQERLPGIFGSGSFQLADNLMSMLKLDSDASAMILDGVSVLLLFAVAALMLLSGAGGSRGSDAK